MPLLYDTRNLTPISQAELDEAVRKHNMFIQARMGGARAMLAYRNLSGLTLRGMPMTGADFSGSLLFDCNMRGVNLDGAVFFSANLQKVEMAMASLVRADLRGCNLKGADFTGANLTAADMREGSMATKDRRGNINLVLQPGAARHDKRPIAGHFTEYVDATEAVFTDAKMTRARMRGINLTHAILEGADLSFAQMQGACLQGAVLRRARMDGVEMHDTDMSGVLREEWQGLSLYDEGVPFEMLLQDHARWLETGGAEGARLDLTRHDIRPSGPLACDFSGRNLLMMRATYGIFYHVNFSGAQMQAAELRGSDMRLARFTRADLRGADFSGANLMRADFHAAQLGPLKLPSDRF
ncbi:MAG TPA: pentapeptide repeat-containing protein, partial [Alphaproteobacteria bacterium]|nr:pentapeptide repeat-containing protein [Alphaproteobacteria bacterium]